MKTLQEFLEEALYIYSIKPSLDVINDRIQSHIYEVLSISGDANKLIDKISKHYDIPKSDFEVSPINNSDAKFFTVILPYKYQIDKWFKDTLKFFGYYITFRQGTKLYIEPIFTKNITNKIYGPKECNGIFYKIIKKELWKEISLRGGLFTDKDDIFKDLIQQRDIGITSHKDATKAFTNLVKDPYRMNNQGYRRFTSRLFFFSAKDDLCLQKAYEEVISQFLEGDDTLKKDDLYVIKINTKGYTLNCYIDTFCDRQREDGVYLFYANGMIPIEMMTKMTLKEFENKIGYVG